MKFYYGVDITRRVSIPEYGPEAYRNDTKQIIFPFGRGQKYPTGKAAHLAAIEYAKSMLAESSAVSVWRMAGSTGRGDYLKEDRNSRFISGWPE